MKSSWRLQSAPGLRAVEAQELLEALEAGVDPEAIRHVGYLAVTTLGFPRAIAALTWIEDVLSPRKNE